MKYHCYYYTISKFGQKSFTKLRSIGWDRRSCNNPQFTLLLSGVANLIFERLREWFEASYFLRIFFLITCTCMTFFFFSMKKIYFFSAHEREFFLGSGRVHIFPNSLTPPSKIKWSMPSEAKTEFLSLSPSWQSMEYANKPSEVLQWKIPRIFISGSFSRQQPALNF